MATAIQGFKAGSGRDALAGIKVIDVDTHLSEPYDLWTAHAPAKWKDRVPQIKEIAGKRQWVIVGKKGIVYANTSRVVFARGVSPPTIELFNYHLYTFHPHSFYLRTHLPSL